MIDINNIPGRSIHRVFLADRIDPAQDLAVRAKVPGRKFLSNYWVGLPNGDRWLVLCNYGNDMPESFAQKLISKEPYTVAIRERDGLVALATAEVRRHRGARKTYLNLMSVQDGPCGQGDNISLPRSYRKRLGQLMRKRPYRLSVCEHALLDFCDREASYTDLQHHMTYSFRFDHATLTYRCGGWSTERQVRS